MNGSPTTHDEEATPKRREPFARWAARISPAAPLVAWGFSALSPEPQSRLGKLVGGSIGILIIVGGLVLALVALRGVRKYGREGIRGPAIAGLVINGALIILSVVAMAVLLPALGRVAQVQNAGYTRAEMEAMPEIIPGSRKIFDETIGFRIEIPAGFDEAALMPTPDSLYSFVRPETFEPSLAIAVRRLGGRLSAQAPAPDIAALQRDFPPGSELRLSTCPWKAYSLDVVTTQFPTEDTTMCAHFAVVSLCREAIQVMVVGPASLESESRELLSALLTGLRGLTYQDSVNRVQQKKPHGGE